VVALPTRRPHQSRHDLAFVVALTALLVVGVLGVLLFNTSMQQQSRLLDSQRARLASLTEQAQELRTSLDELDQPERIAQRAAALHMQPASRPVFLRVGPGGQLQVVNAPRPAAGPAHAG
jgi:cell division protein FtsL